VDIETRVEHWPFKQSFTIAGHTFTASDVLVVEVWCEGLTGWAEAVGAYYKDETPGSMAEQISQAAAELRDVKRSDLSSVLPAGGARNALDCALWDLEAKRTGRPVWDLVGLNPPQPLRSTYTLGGDEPARMAAAAVQFGDATHLKLKLLGDGSDAERVRAVRAARPDVWLMIDANQAFTRNSLEALLPHLVRARVALIEQPLLVGHEADLKGLQRPIPIAADESVQGPRDLPALIEYFDIINIKLDKCGGLTHALAMTKECRRLGFRVMVGNTMGTSLSLAPAYLLGQLCDFVDLDGALFLAADREPGVTYSAGMVTCPKQLWGYPDSHAPRASR
jgi:L-alanine-DL-glutamate epimerase-like enolase superfamily enzyme